MGRGDPAEQGRAERASHVNNTTRTVAAVALQCCIPAATPDCPISVVIIDSAHQISALSVARVRGNNAQLRVPVTLGRGSKHKKGDYTVIKKVNREKLVTLPVGGRCDATLGAWATVPSSRLSLSLLLRAVASS